METIATFFKVSLPEYLQSLPLPETFWGFLTLAGKDWLLILPAAGAVGVVAYLVVSKINCKSGRDSVVNQCVMKDQEKVVHSYDMEDLADSVAFCRCWRSKKFPFCDGSHNAHNKLTGDNVGPLCLSKKTEGS